VRRHCRRRRRDDAGGTAELDEQGVAGEGVEAIGRVGVGPDSLLWRRARRRIGGQDGRLQGGERGGDGVREALRSRAVIVELCVESERPAAGTCRHTCSMRTSEVDCTLDDTVVQPV
jgi:hypothetical protein